MIADTFAGRVHVEWEKGEGAAMTPLGQLPFFIEYLKQGGLFDGWVAGCPLSLTSPNGSCPRGWCKSGGVFALSGGFCRFHQAATAGSLKIGSSLNGAMVSRVM